MKIFVAIITMAFVATGDKSYLESAREAMPGVTQNLPANSKK